MKSYRVTLKSSGMITQLPDSQKIFGALITELAKREGNEVASMLTEAVLNRKMHLSLSNLFPFGYFPMPDEYVGYFWNRKKKTSNRNLKERRAAVKERSYIKWEDPDEVLQDPERCTKLYPYVKKEEGRQLRASVESVSYGIESLETKLYTVPFLTVQEVREQKEEKGRSISEFYFYLQGDEGELLEYLLRLIAKWKKDEATLILGKRSSQGLNKYRISALEAIELPCIETNYYLNLGMLLPDRIDFQKSTLKLFTSERRPFAMAGGWDKSFQKRFISFIDCGSIVTTVEGTECAGKCIPSPYHGNRDIVFGNAFLYPIDLKTGDEK